MCISFVSKNSILALWSIVDTIRAFRLTYMCGSYDKTSKGIPDVLDLNVAKIPGALEYVLWEVPWMKKLYRVERGREGAARMVYTGWDRLPSRPSSSTLTWTNESVFDHIGIGATTKSSV